MKIQENILSLSSNYCYHEPTPRFEHTAKTMKINDKNLISYNASSYNIINKSQCIF